MAWLLCRSLDPRTPAWEYLTRSWAISNYNITRMTHMASLLADQDGAMERERTTATFDLTCHQPARGLNRRGSRNANTTPHPVSALRLQEPQYPNKQTDARRAPYAYSPSLTKSTAEYLLNWGTSDEMINVSQRLKVIGLNSQDGWEYFSQ